LACFNHLACFTEKATMTLCVLRCPACGRERHVHTHMDDMTEAECIHCHHVETVVNLCLNGSNVYPEKER